MDQAGTLRKLLGQNQRLITPILGDLQTDYAACVGRFVLENMARQKHTALLFDASVRGLNECVGAKPRQDLLSFLQDKAALEDLVLTLSPLQYLVSARQGLDALAAQPEQTHLLLDRLHRLPVTCQALYATLSYEAVELALEMSAHGRWLWIVQPTVRSVTKVYQAISSTKGGADSVVHRVIVAGVRSASEADQVFAKLEDTTNRFLAQPLQYAGHLPILEKGAPLSAVGQDMIEAGRRVARAVCVMDEHVYA